MRQIIFLLIAVLVAIGVGSGVYFACVYKDDALFSPQDYVKSRMFLPGNDFEEEFIFFLVKKLGIYKGEFEIIDIVNLEIHGFTGQDYLLITLKTPDGKLCQLTIVKEFSPWSKWKIIPESFSVVGKETGGFILNIERSEWMRDLGITPEDIVEYYASLPEGREKTEGAFIDEKTKKHALPPDWNLAQEIKRPLRLSISGKKQVSMANSMARKNQLGLINSYWKTDYPSEYMGPGYRSYLYNKSKGKR